MGSPRIKRGLGRDDFKVDCPGFPAPADCLTHAYTNCRFVSDHLVAIRELADQFNKESNLTGPLVARPTGRGYYVCFTNSIR